MVGFEEPEVITEVYRTIESGDVESLYEIQHRLRGVLRDPSPWQKRQFRDALRDVSEAIGNRRRQGVTAYA